jgi:Domain of unknown function (DUF4333)
VRLPFSPRYPLVSRAGLLVAVLVAPTVLAGCGTETLDADKAEALITSSIELQTGADVTSVDCPDDVKPEKGGRFTCEVTAADGTKATLNLRQTTEEGDVEIGAPVVHVAIMEDFIAEGLRMKTGKRATVDCPDLVVAKKGGAQVTCRSSSAGKKKNVVAEVDAQGRVTFDQ